MALPAPLLRSAVSSPLSPPHLTRRPRSLLLFSPTGVVRPLPLAEQEFAGWRYVSLKPTAADRSDAPPRNDVAEAQHVSRMQSEQGDIGRLRREEKEERQKAAKNVPMEHTFYERRALAMAALASSSSSSASTRYVAPPPPKAPFRSITLALDTTIALGKKAKKLQRTLTGARAVAAVAHARCPFVSSRLPLTLYVHPPRTCPSPFLPLRPVIYLRACAARSHGPKGRADGRPAGHHSVAPHAGGPAERPAARKECGG